MYSTISSKICIVKKIMSGSVFFGGWDQNLQICHAATSATRVNQGVEPWVSVESRRGAVTLVSRWRLARLSRAASIRFDMVLFPLPAHRTGRADFPHPALGESSRFRPRKASGPFGKTDQAEHLVERRRGEAFLPRPSHLVLGA
jgi:hypothetical protein